VVILVAVYGLYMDEDYSRDGGSNWTLIGEDVKV
jgi:hypothetical protein